MLWSDAEELFMTKASTNPLKLGGGPNDAFPWFAPNVPAADTNGRF
jgi:hypothetical protein